MGTTEVEIALVIDSGDPEVVIAGLSQISDLARYTLGTPTLVQQTDSYFDTPDGALHQAEVSLRLRNKGEGTLITLKGPAKELPGGVQERLEIEGPWSSALLLESLRELSERGVVHSSPSGGPEVASPIQYLADLGLSKIQTRHTNRAIRLAYNGDAVGLEPIAEMTIDTVEYQFPTRRVYHHEIEIEAKGPGSPETVKAISDALRYRYFPVLNPWRHGKLAIGQAVEKLLADLGNSHLLDSQSCITPAGYKLILKKLESPNAARG